MENANHRIEDIFRQRLHDAEVPPPPFVWPAVEHELQKRRRRWVLWFMTLGVVAAAGFWLWRSEDLRTARPDSDHTSTAVVPGNQEMPTTVENHLAGEMEGKNVAALSSAAQLMEQVQDSRTDYQAKGSKNLESSLTPVGRQTLPNASNQPSTRAVEQVVSTSTPEASETKRLVEPSAEQDHWEKPLQNKALMAVASTKASKPIEFPKSYKAYSKRKKAQPKVCYDFARHPSAWLLDVYVGPSLAQRSLTSSLDDQPYLNQRLATEHRNVAMSAGIRASLMFNRNFLLRTGLHYDQVTEAFEFIDPTSVIYRLQFTPGNPIPDTLGVEYGENYLKTYNRYAMLDVPLLVGVEMRNGRSGFNINAGISANLLFEKRGALIDPITHEPARFGPRPKNVGPNADLSEDVFRTNVGLSATASVQWYWHLKPKFRIFVEPSFRQIMRPVTLRSHPVDQRYSILGLRLGATKIF